jgi:ribosomal protein S18 acetylase RimI-like enzyme
VAGPVSVVVSAAALFHTLKPQTFDIDYRKGHVARMIRILPMPPGGSDDTLYTVAELHIRYIEQGVLPMLGARFLARLYLEIARSPRASVQVAIDKHQVCGFIAGCYDIHSTYIHLVTHAAIELLCAAGKSLLTPQVLRRIWALLAYPLQKHENRGTQRAPCPEILAIAVDESQRQMGVGRRLVEAFETAAQGWGEMDRIRVATNVAEAGARMFYEKLGFRPIRQRRHHALVLQIYEKSSEKACSGKGRGKGIRETA